MENGSVSVKTEQRPRAGRRPTRKITTQAFAALRPLLGSLSDARINDAGKVLVEGKTMQEVAHVRGITRQAVGASVDVVWRVFLAFQVSHEAMKTRRATGVKRAKSAK